MVRLLIRSTKRCSKRLRGEGRLSPWPYTGPQSQCLSAKERRQLCRHICAQFLQFAGNFETSPDESFFVDHVEKHWAVRAEHEIGERRGAAVALQELADDDVQLAS